MNRVLSVSKLRENIRDITDYPVKGNIFKDLSPIYADKVLFEGLVENMCDSILKLRVKFDLIASIESQGFILGGALAQRLRKGFVQVRKGGELPPPVLKKTFVMQYAKNTLEIQRDNNIEGEKVLIVDDAIATGKTAVITKDLIEAVKGEVVAYAFVMEISGYGGLELLKDKKLVVLIDSL